MRDHIIIQVEHDVARRRFPPGILRLRQTWWLVEVPDSMSDRVEVVTSERVMLGVLIDNDDSAPSKVQGGRVRASTLQAHRRQDNGAAPSQADLSASPGVEYPGQ